jgi:tRNA modification GTPase
VVECRFDLGGVPAVLADTAGLRHTGDEIEQEGVRRARARAAEADLVLAVFAADVPPDTETLALAGDMPGALLVATKSDLADPPALLAGRPPIPTSARTGSGLAELRTAMTELAARRAGLAEAPLLTRSRHRAALAEAVSRLGEGVAAPLPELSAEAYRAAVQALGRLTGRVGVEDILDIVFGDFCIGK